MATQPEPAPDFIEPQSPPEMPPIPDEPVSPQPDETGPLDPDFINPGENPDETYPPL